MPHPLLSLQADARRRAAPLCTASTRSPDGEWPLSSIDGYRARMLQASSTANGHTATGWGHRPLGIACPCGHRVVIELATLGITSGGGDMRPLRRRPFVCSSCGRRRVSIWLFQADDEVAEFLRHGPPPPEPAPPPPARPIVVDGPPGDFTARGWLRTDGGGWIALVDCDRERYRTDPCLVGLVRIGGKRYDCIAVECTQLFRRGDWACDTGA